MGEILEVVNRDDPNWWQVSTDTTLIHHPVLLKLSTVLVITWVRYPSVRPSTKSFSDSDEIWYVGRGR